MADHDAELDAMARQLVAAGLLEPCIDVDGDAAMRLTPEGHKVARQLAMSDEGDQDALMGALLAPQAAEAARWGYSAGTSGTSGIGGTERSRMTASPWPSAST